MIIHKDLFPILTDLTTKTLHLCAFKTMPDELFGQVSILKGIWVGVES